MEIVKPKYFKLPELVPRHVLAARGEAAWELLDPRLLIVIDRLRERFGPAIINNYASGGDREWSGLRTPGSPYYSPYSQHSFGRAVDMIFAERSAESIRREILKNPDDPAFILISSLELYVSWLHVDVRNCTRVKAFKP